MNNYFIIIIQNSILNINIGLVNEKYSQKYKENISFSNTQNYLKIKNLCKELTYDEMYNLDNKYYKLVKKKKLKDKIKKQKLSLNLADLLYFNCADETHFIMKVYKEIMKNTNNKKFEKYFKVCFYENTNIICHVIFNFDTFEECILNQEFMCLINDVIDNVFSGETIKFFGRNGKIMTKIPEYINNLKDLEFFIFDGRDDFDYFY